MYKADLHIHTCLSPCADIEMSPLNITRTAYEKEIHILAICDHNSAENVPGVMGAAEKYKTHIIGGMEISSREEVHILALFDDWEQLSAMQRVVYDHLDGVNDETFFGDQVVADEGDVVTGFNPRLLMGATDLSVEDIVDAVHRLGGLAVASHVDRECFGIIGQLGMIPPGLALDALEVSRHGDRREYVKLGFPIVSSSDAHCLEDIGRCVTRFYMEAVNLREIKKAFMAEDGRMMMV